MLNALKVELVNKNIFCIAIGWRRLISGIEGRLIVLHVSLLPKYREFAPTVAQLLAGESEIGVTAFALQIDMMSWLSH